MAFTYRTGLGRPLTYQEMDDNLEHVETLSGEAEASADRASGSASDASDSVSDAAYQVTLAANQVALAADQVTLAEEQVELAEGHEQQAQIYAAAAQSAAGIPSLAGNAGRVLGVSADEQGVEFLPGIPASQIIDSSEVGRGVITASSSHIARTVLGLDNATKEQVLSGVANAFVSGSSYHNIISWSAINAAAGTLTLNLDVSLNHDITVEGDFTVVAPTNADPGKTGDIVLRVTGEGRVVSWSTEWKFLGSVPDIGESGSTWVISYKILSSTEVLASAAKVA